MNKLNNRSGLILISVMWIVLILSLVVWGMGRRSAMEIAALEKYRGKVRSYAAARAAVAFVLNLMDESPSSKDTLYCSGIALKPGQTPEDVFSRIEAGKDAYAIVQWPADAFGNEHQNSFGLRDEQGKININAVNQDNVHTLSALFELKGMPRNEADKLAMAVVRYKQQGEPPPNENWLKEDDHTFLKSKKRPYEHVDELLNIGGMTREMFDLVKDDLTVYSDMAGGLWVNMNTANDEVIRALANAAARYNPAANADDIAANARAVRDGQDGRPFTEDDGQESLNADFRTWPSTLRQSSSTFISAHVVGIDRSSGARTTIDAVIRRAVVFSGNRIVAWQRK